MQVRRVVVRLGGKRTRPCASGGGGSASGRVLFRRGVDAGDSDLHDAGLREAHVGARIAAPAAVAVAARVHEWYQVHALAWWWVGGEHG